MSRLQKQIDGTLEKIAHGQFYEAHQAVRTITARLIRQKAYDDAISVLYSSTNQLLDAHQYGSASDLTLYLISTYDLSQTKVDSTSRARLVQLLSKFPVTEPTIKKIGHEITSWASQHGQFKYGDPELNHALGSIFADADEAYEAEKYLLLGTKDSPVVLAKLLLEWSQEDAEPRANVFYLSRGVFGYLAIENIRDAKTVAAEFIDNLPFESQTIEQDGHSVRSFPGHPLLAFEQLLILACQYKDAEMFSRLKNRYMAQIQDVAAFKTALDLLGQKYFGIQPPRQANMLQDLMGSLFQ